MWATCNHQTQSQVLRLQFSASCESGVSLLALGGVVLFLFVSLYLILCLSLLSPLFPRCRPWPGWAEWRDWRQPLSGRDWDHRAGQTRPGGKHSQSGGTNSQNTSQTKQSFTELSRLITGRLSNLERRRKDWKIWRNIFVVQAFSSLLYPGVENFAPCRKLANFGWVLHKTLSKIVRTNNQTKLSVFP